QEPVAVLVSILRQIRHPGMRVAEERARHALGRQRHDDEVADEHVTRMPQPGRWAYGLMARSPRAERPTSAPVQAGVQPATAQPTGPAPAPSNGPERRRAAVGPGDPKAPSAYTLTMQNVAFSATDFNVKADMSGKVTLTLVNLDGMEHNVTIDALGIALTGRPERDENVRVHREARDLPLLLLDRRPRRRRHAGNDDGPARHGPLTRSDRGQPAPGADDPSTRRNRPR